MIGYQTVDELGVKWRFLHGALVPITPPHALPTISLRDAHALVKRHAVRLIRWETDFNQSKETQWWHVIKDCPEDINLLGKKVRWSIRKAETSFTVKQCSRDTIEAEGYSVYRSSFARYTTHEVLLEQRNFTDAIRGLPLETEFWEVRRKDNAQLVGFSENFVDNQACFYVTMWFRPEEMREFCSYLLIHIMNKYYLNERKLLYVSDGARSINHDTQIHLFLQSKFGFRKAYAQLSLVYSWWLGSLLFVCSPFRRLIRVLPSSISAKATVLFRQEDIRRSF
jgi:hypothetical protein